jgi:hypothetical protein
MKLELGHQDSYSETFLYTTIYFHTTTVNNFMDCGFVAPYYQILTYTYTYAHPPSK